MTEQKATQHSITCFKTSGEGAQKLGHPATEVVFYSNKKLEQQVKFTCGVHKQELFDMVSEDRDPWTPARVREIAEYLDPAPAETQPIGTIIKE